MEIFNSTLYNYRVIINNAEYDLKGNSSIFFDCNEKTEIKLISVDKSSVHLDWIEILLMQMFFGSTTHTRLYTNYSFVAPNNTEKITLCYNDWSPRNQISVKACHAKENVENEKYTLSQFEKVKKKHKKLHMLVSNAWPIGLATLIFSFLTDSPLLFIFLFLLWLIVFELPSLKEIKRFNKLIKPEFIAEKLCEYSSQRRIEPIVFGDDYSKTGKIVSKILSKMFKFEDNKNERK